MTALFSIPVACSATITSTLEASKFLNWTTTQNRKFTCFQRENDVPVYFCLSDSILRTNNRSRLEHTYKSCVVGADYVDMKDKSWAEFYPTACV
jgi:hypothetical protein